MFTFFSFLLTRVDAPTPTIPLKLNTNDWGSCVENGVATLSCIPKVFQNIVSAALVFAGVAAVVLIIISGAKFIFSGGEAKQVEGAKHTLTYAIIGLLIILLSFFIINFISGVTGVSCIKMFGFDNCK